MTPKIEAWISVIITAFLAGLTAYQGSLAGGMTQRNSIIAAAGAVLLSAQGHFRASPLDPNPPVETLATKP